MIFKKILLIINQFFGLLLFISFFGTLVSIFIFRRITIYGHNFNTGATLITLVFFSSLIMFIFKPILKSKSGLKAIYQSGWGYLLIILLITTFVLIFGYISIYLPLTSQFLGEIIFSNEQSITVTAKEGLKFYFEFDTGAYNRDGTKIKVTIIGPNQWSANKIYTIAKKESKDSTVSGTSMVSSMEKLPADGEYKIIFHQLENKILIKKIRIFGK